MDTRRSFAQAEHLGSDSKCWLYIKWWFWQATHENHWIQVYFIIPLMMSKISAAHQAKWAVNITCFHCVVWLTGGSYLHLHCHQGWNRKLVALCNVRQIALVWAQHAKFQKEPHHIEVCDQNLNKTVDQTVYEEDVCRFYLLFAFIYQPGGRGAFLSMFLKAGTLWYLLIWALPFRKSSNSSPNSSCYVMLHWAGGTHANLGRKFFSWSFPFSEPSK